jgi:CubicO group peptidase (beta-lactamase class C family)
MTYLTSIDNFLREKFRDRDLPGIAIALVQNGQTTTQAFGYADREHRRIVDADETIFPIGSLTELFVVVALLQLAERGKVALNDDVSKYLKSVQIPNDFSEPVRLIFLMTNTDGFAENSRDVLTTDPEQVPTLRDIIRTTLKSPVYKPGTTLTYGSVGSLLAALVVEEVSGQSVTEYIRQHIFTPLEMTETTFHPQLDAHAVARSASTYTDVKGGLLAMPYLYSTTPATMGVRTTAQDMANFVSTLVNGGCYGEFRLLQPDTIAEMFRPRFTTHSSLGGVTVGFMEYKEYGVRGFVRDGFGMGVRSRIVLLPEQGIGAFIVANFNDASITDAITDQLAQSITGQQVRRAEIPTNFSHSAERFVGTYQYIQADRHPLARFRNLATGTVQITNNFDGTLTLTPLGSGDVWGGFDTPTKLLKTEALVFQRADTGGTLAFNEDKGGMITFLHSGAGVRSSYRKLAWHETPQFHLNLMAGCGIVFLTGVVIWLLGQLLQGDGSTAWALGLVAGITSAVNLAFIVGMVQFAARRIGGVPAFSFRSEALPGWARFVFTLPPFSVVLSVALVLCAMLAFQYGYWSALLRLHYLLVTIAAIVFSIFLVRWRMFGMGQRG